jgi:hypothetical protein
MSQEGRMRAIEIAQTGGPDVLKIVERPDPRAGALAPRLRAPLAGR